MTGNGWKRLPDTLRYLQAIERRLEKLAIDPHRDRAQMLPGGQVQQAWQPVAEQAAARDDREEEIKRCAG